MAFLHVDVRVASALGLHIANGREAILERSPHIHGGQNRTVFSGLLQQLLVVIGRRDVALQQHVRVRVDQSRQDRCDSSGR